MKYRIRKKIGEELNLVIWQTKTKSPIFHLANIFCTRLIQNIAHDLSDSKHVFIIVTMVMLKYVKQETRPSYKQSNLSQQDIEAAQKSDADTINQQQTNFSSVSGE